MSHSLQDPTEEKSAIGYDLPRTAPTQTKTEASMGTLREDTGSIGLSEGA